MEYGQGQMFVRERLIQRTGIEVLGLLLIVHDAEQTLVPFGSVPA
jgi:hypothetical protein